MATKDHRQGIDSKRQGSPMLLWFYAFLAALLVVDLLIPKHGHFPWEEAPAFYAVYGFIACVSLIFIAKGLRKLVRRKEDYYDDPDSS